MTGADDDDNLFAEEMKGVKPLQRPRKVALQRQDDSAEAKAARREAAVTARDSDGNFLADHDIDLLDPYYPLEFRRPGVQHGVFRKFKQGKYTIDARLDLHRMTVAQARSEVFDFIRQSLAYDLRTIMIVPGRGGRTESPGSILKSYVNFWLPQFDEVQAYCSAQPHHGGVGAIYVMLRKSERKKEENRERFTKGHRG